MIAKIENGARLELDVPGVFKGTVGVSRGMVAWIPHRVGKSPATPRGGTLSGVPVMISEITPTEDGRGYTARFELLG